MEDLVVVILLNYNQNDYSLKCIDSLLESDYDNYLILIVDNGSTNENFEILSKSIPINEKVILKRITNNIGYTLGSNYALEEGMKLNPKFFLIMNNDTIIDRSAMKELVKTCKDYDEKARVTGKVYHYDQPNVIQTVGEKFTNKNMLKYYMIGLDELDQGQYDKTEERDMIDDVFVLHPVSLYEEIGGYSPYFWIMGVEKDLSIRSLDNGYKLVFSHRSKLWHKGSVSIGGDDMNPKLAFWNVQSSLILRFLHLKKRMFIIYYFHVLSSITRTYLKSIYLKLFKGKDIGIYAKAKYSGLIYFNKWVFNRKTNDGKFEI